MTATEDFDPLCHQLILRREALSAGSSDRELGRLVRDGALTRIRPGAFVPKEIWDAHDERDRHRLLARAVLSKVGVRAALSHVSAAAELGAPTWGLPLDLVHITRLDRKAGRKEAGVNQHRSKLLAQDVVELNGVPVTSATRLALDITTISTFEASMCVVNHLLNTGMTDQDTLVARYKQMENDPNTLKTGLVLRLADPRIESVGETRTWAVCWRFGLPAPVPQYAVGDAGELVARLDFAWPDLGCWLEFDGAQKYVKFLRNGETVTDVVLREKRREDRIREITGWRCLRVTWADLADPERLARRILAFLGAGVIATRVTPEWVL